MQIEQVAIIEGAKEVRREVMPMYPVLCHCGALYHATCPECVRQKCCHGRPATPDEARALGWKVS